MKFKLISMILNSSVGRLSLSTLKSVTKIHNTYNILYSYTGYHLSRSEVSRCTELRHSVSVGAKIPDSIWDCEIFFKCVCRIV